MNIRNLSLAAACGLFLVSAASAVEPQIERKPVSILVSHEFGAVKKGIAFSETLSGAWIQRTGAYATFEATMDRKLEVKAGIGGVYWYSMPEQPGTFESQNRYFAAALNNAYGAYRFGDGDDPWAQLTMGFFPYKYNKDARNLGEYMFRTGTYPGYVVTGGMTIAKSSSPSIVGAMWSMPGPAATRHDIVLSSSTTLAPFYDFSLAYLPSIKVGQALEVGLGFQFANLIPVKPSHTNPNVQANSYFTAPDGRVYYAVPSYYKAIGDTASALYVDSLTSEDTAKIPLASRPRYKHYSFQGLKLMARANLDLKALVGGIDALGPEDLRLYFETAVLGVKDYPIFYDKIGERIPFMVGFNLPTFGLFDVLNVEGEYYPSRFLNSWDNPYHKTAPVPYVQGLYQEEDPKRDDWKWSVYGERKIVGGFSVVGQVARDHLRIIQWPGITDTREALVDKEDWYWVLRFMLKI